MTSTPLLGELTGPFAWSGPSGPPTLAQTPEGEAQGVYVWTVPQERGELIYYVGQTGQSFAVRMRQHLVQHFSGQYHVYDPSEMQCAEKACLWPGRYGPDRNLSIEAFLDRYDELGPAMAQLARLYRFYLAPLDCEKRLRERIEAAIANHLYAQPGIVGQFQDKGIRYLPRRSDEAPVEIVIRAPEPVIGLPRKLAV